ncbi:hypothetical protein [Synechococcus sp. PCC 7502]|uniref:hypothetical protein n=1 Tax=Synechococcus sp. PCC 7502 TaxID=1173263 RepID=UPI0002E5F1E7|nr:hypothetical protein [Synechococcus sp. PCC 7502]
MSLAVSCGRAFLTIGIFAQFVLILQRSQMLNLFFARLVVVLIAMGGLIWLYNWAKLVYASIDKILISLNFLPSELIFNNYPLSLGEEASVLFRRRLRSGKIIKTAGTVNAKVICEEEAISGKNDNPTITTEKVLTMSLPEVLVPAYESAIEVIFKLKIPQTAPPSFDATHNQIRWILEVSLDFQMLKESSKFYFQVQPQIISTN